MSTDSVSEQDSKEDRTAIVRRLVQAYELEVSRWSPKPPDMFPEYDAVAAWSAIVAGYSLLEQALKALLRVEGKDYDRTHSLYTPLSRLNKEHKEILRQFYEDYLQHCKSVSEFPIKTFAEYAKHLDADDADEKKRRGKGSINWRYALIEGFSEDKIPFVSVEVLHECICAVLQILQCKISENDPDWPPYSKRREKYRWLIIGDWICERHGVLSDSCEFLKIPEQGVARIWTPDESGKSYCCAYKFGQPKQFFRGEKSSEFSGPEIPGISEEFNTFLEQIPDTENVFKDSWPGHRLDKVWKLLQDPSTYKLALNPETNPHP